MKTLFTESAWCKTEIIIWLPVPQTLRHSLQFCAWGTQSHKYHMHRKSRIPALSALQDAEQAFSVGIAREHPGLGRRDRASVLHHTSPSLSLWHDRLTLGRQGRRKDADLDYNFLQQSKQPMTFQCNPNQDRWKLKINCFTSIYLRRFRTEAQDKETRTSQWPEHWENESPSHTLHQEKMTIIQQSKTKQLTRS